MRKLLLSILALTFALSAAQAQRLIIGEKAPDIKIAEWLGGKAAAGGKATLIDFFHSSNEQCVANLEKLNSLHSAYGSRMNVIAVSRESLDKLQPFVSGKGYGFYAGIDDGGKTFTAYGVRFVPFAALIDTRGRLVWTGNVAALTNDMIEKAF